MSSKATLLLLALFVFSCAHSPYDVKWTVSDQRLVEPVRLAWLSITKEHYVPPVVEDSTHHISFAGEEHTFVETGNAKATLFTICENAFGSTRIRRGSKRPFGRITVCKRLDGNTLQSVITHELLHTFRLGHSEHEGSVMNVRRDRERVLFPTEYDYEQLEMLK